MKRDPLSDRMKQGSNEKADLVQLPRLSVKYSSAKKRNSCSLCSKAGTRQHVLLIVSGRVFYQPLHSVSN